MPLSSFLLLSRLISDLSLVIISFMRSFFNLRGDLLLDQVGLFNERNRKQFIAKERAPIPTSLIISAVDLGCIAVVTVYYAMKNKIYITMIQVQTQISNNQYQGIRNEKRTPINQPINVEQMSWLGYSFQYIIKQVKVAKMKKKNAQQQQLHISSFIKDPVSLKLLILAGTNIKQTQLSTISKCTGLIKLDLSSNFLADVPLKFSIFPQMKILYLHDNQLSQADIRNTQLEYISLFKNPMESIKYRRYLIEHNSSLVGIDYNIVTAKQKYGGETILPIYSEIKWPIVQISSNLEHEDDYLNLLKAQIFVIGNVYKRTCKIEIIEKILTAVNQANRYKEKKSLGKTHMQFLPSVMKAVRKWKQFTLLKRKLRAILKGKNKQHLMYSKLDINKQERSPGVSQILSIFIPLVREKMKVRHILERQSRSYRAFIPALKQLQSNYLGFNESNDYKTNPAKLYFKFSEIDIFSKVCLYAKKLFFKEKDYDLCDEFNNLFKQTGRKYFIYRKNGYYEDERSWLMNSIHETKGYVLSQAGIDRKHLIYNKKGHKKIGIKSIRKMKGIKNLAQKTERCDRKINYLFEKYDKLIEYEVQDWKILRTILRIIRYINAGNSSSIISTETAYFQTQVIFNDQKQDNSSRVRLHLGLQFFTKRVIAANLIQRSWRKYICRKKNINITQIIKKQRAEGLIGKWIRNLIFTHRMSSLKTRSYFSSAWRDKQLYFHLDVYMNMPDPTNYLRFLDKPQDKNAFYDILHKNTQVQIVQSNGRRWVKILYANAKEASAAQIVFHKYTYRLCEGFFLKFFNVHEISDNKLLTKYEAKLSHLLKIIQTPQLSLPDQNTKTTLEIDNSQPYFIWSEVNALQHFSRFQKFERHSTTVNIFIYNKHKRPLKVSCEIYWIHQQTLYENKKIKPLPKQKSIKNSPSKQSAKIGLVKESVESQLSFLEIEQSIQKNLRKGRKLFDVQTRLQKSIQKMNRRSSLGSKNNSVHKSHRTRIISDHRLEHLSQTLNIRGK